MKKRPVEVSDHAVLRYLERVGGFNIEGLRASIAAHVEQAAPEGAVSLVVDGMRFVIRDGAGVRVVTTVMPFRPDRPLHTGPDQ